MRWFIHYKKSESTWGKFLRHDVSKNAMVKFVLVELIYYFFASYDSKQASPPGSPRGKRKLSSMYITRDNVSV